MAEALVSTLLEQIRIIIYEGTLEEVRLLKGVKKEMRKLKVNLTSIKALLEGAEQKQISDKTIELWLDRLQEESLDMEDALDEWRTMHLDRPTHGAKNASFLQRKIPDLPLKQNQLIPVFGSQNAELGARKLGRMDLMKKPQRILWFRVGSGILFIG